MFQPLFPIKQVQLYNLYEKAVASFWTVQEVDLERDVVDLDKLTPGEKKMLSSILSFFAASDIIVNENIMQNLFQNCVYAEAQQFYAFQMGIESIHTVLYNVLIERYFGSNSDLFNGIENNIHIKNKAQFCSEYMQNDVCNSRRLVAYAAVEGIFFCSSFACIYYFKKRGLMPGLTFSNELISRDESMHAEFSCILYKTLVADQHLRELPEQEIHQILESAVDHEIAFVNDTMSFPILGFNADMMATYVKFVADGWAVMLGCKKIFNVKNPLEFMDMISLNTKTNFFESRVSEYSRVRDTDRTFEMHADF